MQCIINTNIVLPLITPFPQLILLGCCSLRGVFIWVTVVGAMSGQSEGVLSGLPGDGVVSIDGLEGFLISEANELIDDVELLLLTVANPKIKVNWLLFWKWTSIQT